MTTNVKPSCIICGKKDNLVKIRDISKVYTQCKPEGGVFLCKRHRADYRYIRKLEAFTPVQRILMGRNYQKSEMELVNCVRGLITHRIYQNIRPLWAESDKGRLLEYDICIPDLKVLIEYDGRQHSEYVKIFHKNKRNFQNQLKRDVKKTSIASRMGWKLIRFNHKDKLTSIAVEARLKKERINYVSKG